MRRPLGIRLLFVSLVAMLLGFASTDVLADEKYVAHPNAVPREYLVGFTSEVQIPEAGTVAQALAREYGLTVHRVYKHAFSGFFCTGPIEAAKRLAEDGRVAWVEENMRVRLSAAGSKPTAPWQEPTDPGPQYMAGWTLRRITQRTWIPLTDRPRTDHRYGFASDGEGVRAYIIDTAVLPTHDDLIRRVEPGYDVPTLTENTEPTVPCAGGKDNVCPADTQCENGSHGTVVASLLGGTRYGVAPGVTIVPVRVMPCISNTGFGIQETIDALDWIAGDILKPRTGLKGAVVNMSFEISTELKPEEKPRLPAYKAAIGAVVNAGGVMFAAAGNNPANDNHEAGSGNSCTVFPAGFSYSNGESAPHVISVSGTNSDDRRVVYCTQAPYTGCTSITQFSYGKCVDFFAPAVDVKAAAIRNAAGREADNGMRLTSREGTSFAAPIAAGIAARLLSELNLFNRQTAGFTSDIVYNALLETATPNIVQSNADPIPTTKRMLYIGGVAIKKQPHIVKNVQSQGVWKAELGVEAARGVTGSTLEYEWHKGAYTSAPIAGATAATYLAPRDEAADYWVRVTESYLEGQTTRRLTTDSAKVAVTYCPVPPMAERPRIDVWDDVLGSRRLTVNATGTKYHWFSGPYDGDVTNFKETLDGNLTVPIDVATIYWVRIFNGDCIVDSAPVHVAPICPIPADISIEAVVPAQFKTKPVRLKLEGSNEDLPTIRVPKDGFVALTMRVKTAGPLQKLEWSDGLGETKESVTYFKEIKRDLTLRAVAESAGCPYPRARLLRVDMVDLESRLYLPKPPYEFRYKQADGTPTISVDFRNAPTAVQWRRSDHDDRVAPVKSTDYTVSHFASFSTTKYKVPGPGKYWVRFITASNSGDDRGLMDDTGVFTVVCEDCAVPATRLRIREMIRINGEGRTYYMKEDADDPVTLDAAIRGNGEQYEWRAGAYDVSAEVLGRDESLTTAHVGEIWVRTIPLGGTAFDSYLLTIDAPPDDDNPYVTVEITPSSGAIALERTAYATATAHDFCDETNTKFTWYSENPDAENSTALPEEYGPKRYTFSPTDDVIWWVKATNEECGEESPAVEVKITVLCEPPANVTIVPTPTDTHLAQGDLIGLHALGLSKAPLYTWYQGTKDDPSSTPVAHGPGLLRQPTTEVTYWVRVEDGCGNAATKDIKLYVCKPSIDTPLPELIILTPGETRELLADASPAQPGQQLFYQWYAGDLILGGTPITGATARTYTVTEAGSYYVVVRGKCSDTYEAPVNSTAVRVVMCHPPVIQDITSREIAPGQTGVISVTATGSNLTYQWYRGESGDPSQLIQGETFAALSASPTATTNYWCRVTSDNSCSTDSETTQITVCEPPQINEVPEYVSVGPNSEAELYVLATGATGYQWYDADTGNPITGATSENYTTPPLTEDKRYFVRVFNGECHTDSDPITVLVCRLSASVSTNKTQIVTGESALITATVTFPRSQELYYTWYSGPTELTSTIDTQGPGISSILRSPSVTTWYRVVVNDGTCEVQTDAVKVTYCVSPTVNVHPISQLLDKTQNPSATKELVAGATGGNATWQWYIGESGNVSTPIPGATSPSLTVSPSQDTWYWARATGTCGYFDDSDAAKITVCQQPAITTQPASRIITANTPTTIQVTATGTNLSYQWYKGPAGNTTTPVGTNAATITVTVATTTEYWVRITGACGSINSAVAMVSVAPTVTPLAEKRVTKGTTATFTVSASGTYLSYQWYYSPSTLISGATSATFTTPPLYNSTALTVRVQSGQTYSETTVNATVCQAKPISVSQPSNVSGSNVTLSIVGPDPNESYSWYRGDSGNTAVYLGDGTSKVVNPDVTTNYWFRSAGYGCYADSATVTVTVCVPRVTSQPVGGMINPGGTLRLSVAAVGTPGLTYQWYGGGVALSGATLSYYDAAPQNDTVYYVRVKSDQGASCWVNSNSVTVSVCKPPSISSEPQSISPPVNTTTNLGVTANGTDLTYQWYERTAAGTNVLLSGATSNIYPVYANSTRSYWVRVNGRCGTKDSQIAKVSVPPSLPAAYAVYVPTGQSATFTVNASGNDLTYQWYQGSTPQPNGTSATFVTPILTADTNFWVRVWSGNASLDSTYYPALVCQSHAVSVYQPSNVSGSAVTLSVSGPAADESYMWYDAAGNAINSGTQITVLPAGTTSYRLRTTRGTCSADTVVPVTICVPKINTQPVGSMVNPGQPASVSVVAQGSGPLSYQWYSGSTAIPNANGSSYSWVPTADTTVWVRVWSTQGGSCYVDSAAVNVQVCKPPSISANPQSESIHDTTTVQLSVTATGTDLTYQWYEVVNGSNVLMSGATSNVFPIQPGTTRSFWVRVSGRCGYTDSAVALISVYPRITAQPTDRSVCSGASTTFSIGATGSNMVFRWYTGPSGTKTTFLGSGYQLPITVSSATTVWCEVSSGNAAVNSQVATASVQPGPAASISKWWGGFNFYLTAQVHPDDGPYVTYAWYRGPLGNMSQPYGGSATIAVYDETTTTYWVRVLHSQTGCWTDRSINVPW